MNPAARREVERYATEAFSVARDRINQEYPQQRNQAIAQARQSGNTGSYVPALTKCAAEKVRNTILALADAYVEAFKVFGLPSDREAERCIETYALQTVGGAMSEIDGQLQHTATRIRKPLVDAGGYVPREIERSMRLAVKEGKLRLIGQRAAKLNFDPPAGPERMVNGIEVADPGVLDEGNRVRSQFWREFEARFRELERGGGAGLYARWTSSEWNASGQWALGGADEQIVSKFQFRVGRAAAELGHSDAPSALFFWLDLLKRDSPRFKMTGSGTPDNGITGIEFGEITGVCDASADYCLKLDTDEVVRATANRNTSFWESLRLDFTKLRDECAINPPLLPAGQLSARIPT